jgi:hypothetical protein
MSFESIYKLTPLAFATRNGTGIQLSGRLWYHSRNLLIAMMSGVCKM